MLVEIVYIARRCHVHGRDVIFAYGKKAIANSTTDSTESGIWSRDKRYIVLNGVSI